MDIAAPGAGERLAEIMKAEGVDSVIHFAARKQVGESVEKPLWYYQQNLNGVRRSARLDARLQRAWDTYADTYLLNINAGQERAVSVRSCSRVILKLFKR